MSRWVTFLNILLIVLFQDAVIQAPNLGQDLSVPNVIIYLSFMKNSCFLNYHSQ
jgi:hypothetical protein